MKMWKALLPCLPLVVLGAGPDEGEDHAPLSGDPLRKLAERAGEVAGDLSRHETSKAVQEKQADIVRQLDRLIAVLEQKGCST